MINKNDERVLWTDKPHNFFGLPVNFTRYFLTSEKLLIRRGLIHIREEEVMLFRILDKSVDIPLWQRIFHCGTVKIYTKDASTSKNSPTSEVFLKEVKNVDKLIDTLDELIKESRKAYQIMGREIMDGGDYPGGIL